MSELFGTTGHILVSQECARAVLIFLYGLLLVRVSGRRIFGKWAALDIIVSIMVGSNLSRALTGNAPLLGTLAASTLLMALHWALSHLAARLPAISRLVEGRSIELGVDGKLMPSLRKRHAVTQQDLDEALRKTGLERAEDARKIVLEPSGNISVLRHR